MSKFRNILRGTIGAVAIGAAVVAFVPSSASAAPATPAPAGNVVQIPLTRVVNTPGDTISIGQTKVIQVAGKTFGNGVSVPANATGVFGRLVAFQAPHGESLVVWDGVKGKPGDATVTAGPTTPASSGPSQAFTSSLNNGSLSVASLSGSGSFLLEATGYVVPAAAAGTGPQGPKGDTGATGAPGKDGTNGTDGKDGTNGTDGKDAPAPDFGVADVNVDGTTWGAFDVVEAGGPVGDIAAGFTRFSCKNATDGCNVTVEAYSTATGEVLYPDLLLTKENNVDGSKVTCEYADGSDNNGATTALTGTKAAPTAVPLGIGGTADCGGNQTGTQPASVDHINVPGATGQGIHYDVDVKFVFEKAAA